MDVQQPLTLLGGLSPAQFMRRYWHKKPLLARQAVPGFKPPVGRARLLALAAREDVESRFIQYRDGQWLLRHGPLARRSLPSFATRRWSVLVQGVDLHDEAVHALLQQFRFVPQARLDDLMISYASDGGGVGPHFDSYDVFLLQAHGRRRWRIGRQKNAALIEGLPLKILRSFEPEQEMLLEPGDMLYLPPGWAHDGVAEGECMTYSVGFRSPSWADLAREILPRLADAAADEDDSPIYRDPRQGAVTTSGEIPAALQAFARQAVRHALAGPQALERALGETLTEPKPNVWFEPSGCLSGPAEGVTLDRRTRMMYDARHVYINGESYRATGRDAALMRRLADQRCLQARDLARASAEARELLAAWCEAGWTHGQ
jgi:50S ribosomal protein L16 3-hydroxylase